MLFRLIQHIIELSPEDLRKASLEDMAFCCAWCESYEGNRLREEQLKRLTERIVDWIEHIEESQSESEGRRHQWVLRDLIDELRDKGPSGFQRDELDFLCAAYQLANRLQNRALFTRCRSLVMPYVNEMEVRRSMLEAAPGLPALSRRINVVITEDIEEAKSRDITTISGIPMPSRGPLLSMTGHVKVLGSVPEDCTLVVEEGCCRVEGYVMGRLALRDDCDVRENIAGVVISRLGDVRARGIITRAYVVAKAGKVCAKRTENPELIFAGESIQISDKAVGGQYAAPEIRIRNAASGGRFEVSRLLQAELFRCRPSSPLVVVLRGGFSCEDYGETRSREANRLLSQAIRLRQRISSLRGMSEGALREAEQCAQSAVYYICSGDEAQKYVKAIQSAKNRLAVLSRIVSGFCSLNAVVEEVFGLMRHELLNGRQSEEHDPATFFSSMDSELKAMASGGTIDEKLAAIRKELQRIRDKLMSAGTDMKVASSTLARLREHLSEWALERRDLLKEIELNELQLRKTVKIGTVIPSQPGQRSFMDILKHFVAEAGSRQKGDQLTRKVNSTFVDLMLRTAAKNQERAEKYDEEAREKRERFLELSEKLRKEHQIQVSLEGPQDREGPKVLGAFEFGVRIFPDLFAAREENPQADNFLQTGDTGGKTKTYMRDAGGIVEVAT